MRFLAIHFDGYGGGGSARASFEIEADGPDAVPTGVFPTREGSDDDLDVICGRDQLRVTPWATASQVAMLAGGQHVGFLARKDNGLVVAGSNGLIPADKQFHWREFNQADNDPALLSLEEDSRPPAPDLISISEIVDTHGVGRKTVMRWLAAGKIVPAMTLPGRTGVHLFTRAEAEAAFSGWRRRGPRNAEWTDAGPQTADTSQAQDPPMGLDRATQADRDETGSAGCGVGTWVSEYDFDRRTVTLTRVESQGTDWRLFGIVRDDDLSDPHGRFEVYVEASRWSSTEPSGDLEIAKIVARLEDNGSLSAWHPDFREELICEGTAWGVYYRGYRGPEGQMPRHWVYRSHGDIIRPPVTQLRRWAEAHNDDGNPT
ncbi:hypothetical protein [Tessaracoccus sp. Y1736]